MVEEGLILTVGGPTEVQLRQQFARQREEALLEAEKAKAEQERQVEQQRIEAEERKVVEEKKIVEQSILQEKTRIEAEQAALKEQQAALKAEQARIAELNKQKAGYQFGTINKATKNKPQTFEVKREFSVAEFGSLEKARAAADRFAEEFSKDPAFRAEPKTIRRIPLTPVPKDPFGREILAPKFTESQLRQELIKKKTAQNKLALQAFEKSKEGIPISRAEREAFNRTKFDVTVKEKGKPEVKVTLTGKQVGIQSVKETKKLQLDLRLKELEKEKKEVEKIRDVPTTRAEFVSSLLERKGFKVTERDKGIISAVRPGEQVIVTPTNALVAKGLVTGEKLKFAPEFTGRLAPTPIKKVIEPVTKLEKFEQKVEAQEKRQAEFFESPSFERIERTAGVLTLGRGVPIEERSLVGGSIQALVRDIMGFPIALGGAVGLTAEKIKLTGEALTIPEIQKRGIGQELIKGSPKRIVTSFQDLPTREKIATGLFIATAPFLGGGPVRRLVLKRATKAKAVSELSPKEVAQLERFELSIEELKDIRVKPKRLNLAEVERLPPKAAAELDTILVENKGNVVVGGSVAQRTQIIGKSRLPADIDIFTSRNTRQFSNEIAQRLRDAGVERVSVVKGKQITIAGKKAIEVKDVNLLKQNIKKVQLPFQTFGSALETTPRGIKVLRLGAQAQRKVVGGFGLEQERIRTKDIGDLPDILRSLRVFAKEKRASVLIGEGKPLKPFAVPISKGLLTEAPSLDVRGVRRPPMGGFPSFIRQAEIQPPEVSILKLPKREMQSVIVPSRELPSIITPLKEAPSVIVPPSQEPSIIVPSKEVPSIIVQTEDVPSIIVPKREIPSIIVPSKDVPSIIEPIKEIPEPKKVVPGIGLRVEKRIRRPAYQLFVREGEKKSDKFILVQQGILLPKLKAINKGARIVDNTTARSFKIKRKGTTTIAEDKKFFLREKFRARIGKTKLPTGTFVEKSKFAIDSVGEVAGIPFSPIRIPRLREALARKAARRKTMFSMKTTPIGKVPKLKRNLRFF